MTVNMVREILRRECEKAGGQGKWAAANGVTGAYVSDVLNGARQPGDAILQALHLEKITRYRKLPR